MKLKIFFGSFHLKMEFNYLIDLVKRSKTYNLIITKSLEKKYPQIFDEKSEVLVVKMPSRMRRGKKRNKVNPLNKRTENEIDEYYHSNTVYIQYERLYGGKIS